MHHCISACRYNEDQCHRYRRYMHLITFNWIARLFAVNTYAISTHSNVQYKKAILFYLSTVNCNKIWNECNRRYTKSPALLTDGTYPQISNQCWDLFINPRLTREGGFFAKIWKRMVNYTYIWNWKAISPKIMMQEPFYAFYVFTVRTNGGVATTPYLSTLKTYPTPGEGPIHPVFASKWLQRMPGQLLIIISRKNRAF